MAGNQSDKEVIIMTVQVIIISCAVYCKLLFEKENSYTLLMPFETYVCGWRMISPSLNMFASGCSGGKCLG